MRERIDKLSRSRFSVEIYEPGTYSTNSNKWASKFQFRRGGMEIKRWKLGVPKFRDIVEKLNKY